MTDTAWDDLYERSRLEIEVQVLAAEAAADRARCGDAELLLACRRHPDDPTLATMVSNVRRLAASQAASAPRRDWEPRLAGMYVEEAVYTWRRDYGEWPTRFNLADRLANTTGLTRRQAEARILATINVAADGYHVHCVRSARLREILAFEDHGVGPWNLRGEDDLRFYLLAEAQDGHAESYTDRYLAEAVA